MLFILNEKDEVASAKGNVLNEQQIEKVTQEVVRLIKEKYPQIVDVPVSEIVAKIKRAQDNSEECNDKYGYLSDKDTAVLKNLVQQSYSNPYLALDERRESLNLELEEMPKKKEQLEEYKRALSGSDYSIIERYENNDRKIGELKTKMADKKAAIKELEKKYPLTTTICRKYQPHSMICYASCQISLRRCHASCCKPRKPASSA